jgi:hypothetical protein
MPAYATWQPNAQANSLAIAPVINLAARRSRIGRAVRLELDTEGYRDSRQQIVSGMRPMPRRR